MRRRLSFAFPAAVVCVCSAAIVLGASTPQGGAAPAKSTPAPMSDTDIEQFLLKARSPRVCIASYEVVSCRRDGKQCELHARFAGFVANPTNLSAGQFATALAA